MINMERIKKQFEIQTISGRIIVSFGLIFLIVIVIVQLLIIQVLQSYYYDAIQASMFDRLMYSIDRIESLSTNMSLDEKAKLTLSSISSDKENYLIQIIDPDGVVVLDSVDSGYYQKIETADVISARQYQYGYFYGRNEETGENIMALTAVFKKNSTVTGMIRYSVSMEKVDNNLFRLYSGIIVICFLVLAIIYFLMRTISKSIVYPITMLNKDAREMVDNNFEIRAEKVNDDEVGELTDTINYLADEVVKSDNIKNEFISSVSHELRTPLTSIQGWSETLLADVEEGSMMQVGLNIISGEAERLKYIVEELLDFSRMETNSDFKVNKKPIHIAPVLKSVYEQFLPRTNIIEISYEWEGEDPVVLADENRMKQVFINIIGNALKFSTQGGTIDIKGKGTEEEVIVTIQDDGIGISEENLKKARQRFFKANLTSPGSGLGLSIVDSILKLHDGELQMDSKLDVGTVMTVRLPVLKEKVK